MLVPDRPQIGLEPPCRMALATAILGFQVVGCGGQVVGCGGHRFVFITLVITGGVNNCVDIW